MKFSQGFSVIAVLALGLFGAARADAGTFPSIEYQDFYLSYR